MMRDRNAYEMRSCFLDDEWKVVGEHEDWAKKIPRVNRQLLSHFGLFFFVKNFTDTLLSVKYFPKLEFSKLVVVWSLFETVGNFVFEKYFTPTFTFFCR